MANVETTDAAMEQQIDDDEDDFWGSRNDDDDLFVPRRRPEPEYGQDEDDSFHQYSVKEEEVEDEGNGNHVIGVDEDDDAMDDFDAVEGDDDISARAIKGLRFKRKTVIRTEQTIGGNIEEKKTKKKLVEEVGKENGVMEEKKKKEKEEMEKQKEKEKKEKEKLKEKEKEEKLKKEKEKVVTEDVIEEETIMEEEVTGEKKKKKKRSTEDGEKEKSKKKKKKKRRESEKENKKAAYQKRDDILEKHVGPRVRSFDAAKMKSKFEKPKQVSQVSSECRQCGKQVFQMEKIVAEKAAWHKNCFRCKECSCILTLETYQSHEGVLYCKPHFKELFRPKVVVEDPDEARRERLLRRPKMIVLESQPEALPEGVVRSSNKPDYGLDDLSTSSNLKQKFAMFEHISTEEDRIPETIPVRRSHSLLSKAARFMQNDDDDYGIENAELGEYEEDEDDDDEEEDEEEGEGGDEDLTQKKSRSTSFTGIKDLKAGFARKNRRDELSRRRRQELAKFRQMLCAGKNISTREMFEGGNLEDGEGHLQRKEQIKIEGSPDAKNLRERFEKGLSVAEDDEDEREDRREVDRVFKEAETASKARNLFKEIDKTVAEGGEPVMRPKSSSAARRENRLSQDGKRIRNFTSQVFEDDSIEEEEEETTAKSSIADRFKFFATYEDRANDEGKRRKKLFRITPPPDGEDQVDEELVKTHLPKRCMAFNCAVCRLRGNEVEDLELGRDPNLIKYSDNYEDEVDCRGTRSLLAKFRKLEMKSGDRDAGPRPLKRFTPPPEGEDYDSDEEYSDEEYTDDDDEDSEDDSEEDEDDEQTPKYKDEVLEMVKSSQSARKAASLRAKFEKWETEVERNNEYNQNDKYEDEEECMPSIDTARNLRAMFENKAQEVTRPADNRPKVKVNRFV